MEAFKTISIAIFVTSMALVIGVCLIVDLIIPSYDAWGALFS